MPEEAADEAAPAVEEAPDATAPEAEEAPEALISQLGARIKRSRLTHAPPAAAFKHESDPGWMVTAEL